MNLKALRIEFWGIVLCRMWTQVDGLITNASIDMISPNLPDMEHAGWFSPFSKLIYVDTNKLMCTCNSCWQAIVSKPDWTLPVNNRLRILFKIISNQTYLHIIQALAIIGFAVFHGNKCLVRQNPMFFEMCSLWDFICFVPVCHFPSVSSSEIAHCYFQ